MSDAPKEPRLIVEVHWHDERDGVWHWHSRVPAGMTGGQAAAQAQQSLARHPVRRFGDPVEATFRVVDLDAKKAP